MADKCEECGKPCPRRWCSQSCNAVSRRKGREVKCEHCGRGFYLRATYEQKGGGRFCSAECRRAYEAAHSPGYLRIRGVYEHRRVMEVKLGRKLRPGEVVHHIDGNRRNNKPENLELFSSHSEHKKHESHSGKGFTREQAIAAGRRSGEVRRHRAPTREKRSR